MVLSTSRILGVKDLGAEMELQLPLEVASEFPPEIFARHRHRHFENLVSRKMQSLCNPKNCYCPSVSLYHDLPVCLNINHYHTTPAPPLSLTALSAFLSPLFVHVKYRTSEQVGQARPGQAVSVSVTMWCCTGWSDTPVNPTITYISIRQP